MDYIFKTVLKEARAEISIEKSKFIATVSPCSSKEEAEAFFDKIRSEFKDATHNVPAFIVGNKMELKWASDDGEPQGTSGPPILKLFEYRGLTNLAIVVTRYFGGIKLGTGGLVRAYTESAEKAIDASGIAGAINVKESTITVDYSGYNRLISYKFPADITETLVFDNPEFTDDVKLKIKVSSDKFDNLIGILREILGGNIKVENTGEYIASIALTE